MLSGAASSTGRALVVGDPIAHSQSPLLHTAAYTDLGLRGWSYDRAQVPAGTLAAFVDTLPPLVCGLSVTMPLKEEAAAIGRASAGVQDAVDALGAANTLVRVDGGWAASNTDVAGILGALDPQVGADPDGAWSSVTVLGSGATARAALAAVAARGGREVTLLVRDRARPETLACAGRLGLRAEVAPLDGAMSHLARSRVVISTLPTGAVVPVDDRVRLDGVLLLDVVYGTTPPAARALVPIGARAVPGEAMLVYQAVDQVHLMTGRRPEADALFAALAHRGG